MAKSKRRKKSNSKTCYIPKSEFNCEDMYLFSSPKLEDNLKRIKKIRNESVFKGKQPLKR